jgi:MauM/NapG family ferredoxin protein
MAWPVLTTSGRRRVLSSLLRAFGTLAAVALSGRLLESFSSRPRAACLRPPGALEEDEFLARCIRCRRCADACPNQCITAFTPEAGADFSTAPGAGQHGTPVIFPRRQACILCNGVAGDALLCTAACPTGALRLIRKDLERPQRTAAGVDMGTSVVDRNLCYSWNGSSCGVCVRACPLEGLALKAGLWEKPIVDPAYCVGCGLCERACIRYPQAIQVEPRNARREAA